MATVLLPKVFVVKALYPTATLRSALVIASPAAPPIKVFSVPVVIAPPVSYPIPTL